MTRTNKVMSYAFQKTQYIACKHVSIVINLKENKIQIKTIFK